MSLQSFARRFSRRNLLRTQWGHVTGRSLINLTLIVVGAGLTAVSVDVFLNPNNVVPGGFTALAMFANRLWGWPVGLTLLVMNVPFLLAAMAVLGVQFGPKTLLATVIASLAIDFLDPFLPEVRGQPHRRLANIASAVKPPGTTLLGFRKTSTDTAVSPAPTTMRARLISERPVTWPHWVRSRFRRLNRLAND